MPNIYTTDVLTETQLAFLAGQLPEPENSIGRPAYTNRELLPGILRVLRSGCRWRDLDLPGYPSDVTHWRRLRYWKKKGAFSLLWQQIIYRLVLNQRIQTDVLSIDGTLVQSFAFAEMTGYSGHHHKTGVKVSLVVEGRGLPVSMVLAPGNRTDIILAEDTIKGMYLSTRMTGSILDADRGYDSGKFRRLLKRRGMQPNVKPTSNTKRRDGIYAYDPVVGKKRYVIERANGWLKSFRRLRMRFDYTTASFEAFLFLAIIVICLRRLMP